MFSFLRRWFAAWRSSIELGKPARITSDVVIQFRGDGPARFRIQHARDDGGVPDDISWCDVSGISNRKLSDPHAVLIDHDEKKMSAVRTMLVEQIDGDHEAVYRRHSAGWIRVIPFDDDDPKGLEQCQAYTITLKPVTA